MGAEVEKTALEVVFPVAYDKESFDGDWERLLYMTDLYLPIADSEPGPFIPSP